LKTLFTGATAALSLILGFEHDATAQRATQQPSSETAAPSNAPPPPPPGLMASPCGSAIVCGGELRHTNDPANAPGQAFTNAVASQERDAVDHQENISLNYAVPAAMPCGLTVGAGINHVHIAGHGSWSFGSSVNLSVPF